MKNFTVISIFILAISSCKAVKQVPSSLTNIQDSLMVDSDGNRYIVKKFFDNNLWMTTNLKLNLPGSYCYAEAKENCEKYGRLYTWETAKKGCSLLGEGWRLPTDDEWLQMTRHYGFPADSVDFRKRAYKALLYDGSAGFNAVLGGNLQTDGKYARLEAHGFYWTSTELNDSTAIIANFGKGGQALYRNDDDKSEALSVRCVKKVEAVK